MITAGIAVAIVVTPNPVHADANQNKLYCGSFCVSGNNQAGKQVCETFGEDCHNLKQLCSLENDVKCTKG
jgi:hypothetical protein